MNAPAAANCTHPAPVTGIMAHEFGHYAGAQGPEGKRRTVTFYGPVIGGMPIQAWHCADCGLLRLEYPDGRREERQLYPGPQPGLLAEPTPADPQQSGFGMQARVSGLSLSADLEKIYTAVPRPPRRLSIRDFPDLNFFDWAAVVLLAAAGIGLLVVALMAVAGYTTAVGLPAAAWITLALFATAVVMQLGRAVLPQLGRSSMSALSDAMPWQSGIAVFVPDFIAVVFLGLAGIGLLAAGILATYDLATPGAEGIVVLATVFCFLVAGATALYSWIRNRGDTAAGG